MLKGKMRGNGGHLEQQDISLTIQRATPGIPTTPRNYSIAFHNIDNRKAHMLFLLFKMIHHHQRTAWT